MTSTRAFSAALLSALIVVSAAPAALAQSVPGTDGLSDAVGGVTGSVGGTTGGVTDTAGGATGSAGGGTGSVGGTVGGTTGGVTDTVDETKDTVDNSTGGTIDDTKDTVDNSTGGTIDDTKDTVDKTAGGTIDDTKDTVDKMTGGGTPGESTLDEILGGGTGLPALEDLTPRQIDEILEEGAVKGLSPAAAEGWIQGQKILDAGAAGGALISLTSLVEELASDFAQTSSGPPSDDMTLSSAERDSFFDNAGRAAVVAGKALAFPLALALLVAGFLAVQGRIGRKDPKLVLAPVTATEDTLTFE